jgi:queuine tRNA-ribosyltransferase
MNNKNIINFWKFFLKKKYKQKHFVLKSFHKLVTLKNNLLSIYLFNNFSIYLFSTNFHFEIIHNSTKSNARVGKIYTNHGIIDTPCFVPVATNASLKSIDLQTMYNHTKIPLIFCNTYHLLVHPGSKIIEDAGGLHKFMNYNFPIITDSGGFQAFSMSYYNDQMDQLKGKSGKKYKKTVLKVTEEGILLKSYRDGSRILLTPESSIQAQKSFGSDIIIPLDELPPLNISHEILLKSFERTHRWELRSLEEHLKNSKNQAIFSVIHGGTDKELRKKSIEILEKLPFDGHTIGGSIGKDRNDMLQLLEFMVPLIPSNKPIHLLGIGDIISIEKCIQLGIDSFDSAYPCRIARHGNFLIKNGKYNISNSENKNKHFETIDKNCLCHTCKNYSRSYLYHLYKTHESSYSILSTIHNIHFMMNMMDTIRNKILNNEI